MPAERALVLCGGYPGHQPEEAVKHFIPFLGEAGFEVIVKDTLAAYEDASLMSSVALILQNWTTGDLTVSQFHGLSAAVRSGAGLVGWHGGLCDAFRHLPAYQFMTGGQWLAHPGGSAARYTIDIADGAAGDPVVAGLGSFSIVSEQYYLAVDPAVEVLATTTFRRPAEAPWIEEAVIPAVWRRRWDRGRVFYVSWGHAASDFDVPPARVIVERGLLWAAGRSADEGAAMNDLLYVSDVSPYRPERGEPAMAGVHQSLGSAATALEEMAGLCGLGFRHAARAADISPGDLENARLLVLFTIGETPWSQDQREVVERRAAAGALGIVGLHSATDAAYRWPAIGSLLGGRFNGHPITGELPVTVVDAAHPATAHLPSPWRFRDELYLFRELAGDARVLLAVQLGGDETGTLPIAWCVERPPVRTFYTALGHFVAAYEDADYLRHVLGGIRWVLGPADPAGSADGTGGP